MDSHAERRWQSWKDDMASWCERPDFAALLPGLLEGEDRAFSRYILDLAARHRPPPDA